MKTVKGWWFGTTERKLLNGDGRKIVIGKTHKVDGEIAPCLYGLHLSKRIIDALQYAPGPVIYKVEGSGVIVPHGEPVDKYACSERTYIAGGIDISDILRKFARLCALDVIHLWDAPDVVVKYLRTGDESLRESARESAWASARVSARESAWESARESARASARVSARESAWASAWESARESARASARASAWVSAWASAWESARVKQNKRLTRMVNRRLKEIP